MASVLLKLKIQSSGEKLNFKQIQLEDKKELRAEHT